MSWEFFLGRASDMAILARITDATNKSLSPVFNQKGSFSCTIKIDSAAALLVEKWKHCIMVQKPDGTTLAWSGPIVSIVDSANEGTTTITAQGWQSELDYRWIRTVAELQEAVAYATPLPTTSNPSFSSSNTNGWTTTGSTKNTDTGTYDTAPASLRWDNTGASDNLTAGDTLSTTFTGNFVAGVTYEVTIYMKTNSSNNDLAIKFGDTTLTNYGRKFPSLTGLFAAYTVEWKPDKNYTDAKLLFTSTSGGYRYWIDSVSITDSIHAAVPTFVNPSFTTDTSGWSTGTSTITRTTSVVDSGSAAGRWDNTGASDNLDSGDQITTDLSGKFYAGVTYTITARIKSSSTTATDTPLLMSFGSGSDVFSVSYGFDTLKFKTLSINWTPSATVTTASFFLTIIAASSYFYLTIDSCHLEQQGGNTVFTDINDGKIAEALVRLANRQTDSDGNTRATHLTPIATSTTPRTRTYQVGQNIGAAIRELSEIENGFDIEVDPVTREIDFIPNTSYTDQTDIAYGYKTFPNNLDDVVVNDDGTGKANSINVQGAFIVGNADSLSDIADVGIILEDWLSAADIKDEQIVGAYANEELVFRTDGQMTIAAKPARDAPMPYIDYSWGDKVYISANRGRMQLDRQAARVFSGRISWDSQNEAILDELGLTP